MSYPNLPDRYGTHPPYCLVGAESFPPPGNKDAGELSRTGTSDVDKNWVTAVTSPYFLMPNTGHHTPSVSIHIIPKYAPQTPYIF